MNFKSVKKKEVSDAAYQHGANNPKELIGCNAYASGELL